MRKWRQWNIEWESVLFKHKLRVKRVSEVSGIYGICKVYQREKFRCLNFQVTGVKLFCGGTTLHFIALSYKDRAVISWKPSSYLTQFHRCDIKVAYYIGYLYSSRRVSHLYYRSGMRVNWTIYIYIYIYIYTYIWIRKRRGVSLEKIASFWDQHHCTETRRWTCWNDRTTHSDPFLTAGVRSPVWVSVATHRWLTPVG